MRRPSSTWARTGPRHPAPTSTRRAGWPSERAISGFGVETVGYRRRLGRRLRPTLPAAQLPARRRPARAHPAREPGAAADHGRADRGGAAQAGRRHGQPEPGVRLRASLVAVGPPGTRLGPPGTGSVHPEPGSVHPEPGSSTRNRLVHPEPPRPPGTASSTRNRLVQPASVQIDQLPAAPARNVIGPCPEPKSWTGRSGAAGDRIFAPSDAARVQGQGAVCRASRGCLPWPELRGAASAPSPGVSG